jgi:uncharacterized protein YeaO (DUF488 family)
VAGKARRDAADQTSPAAFTPRDFDPKDDRESKMLTTDDIHLKRAYDAPADSDGTRVLVDRLWPRGVKKADAKIHHWAKEIAPSDDLRKWFGHDPDRWDGFRDRFRDELKSQGAALEQLRELARKGRLTLIYAAHDEVHNNAVALRDVLLQG